MTSTGSLNDRLKQLVLKAQDYPPRTGERQRALNPFFDLLLKCGKLYHPPISRLPLDCRRAYQDIYREAQQNLLRYLCENIHEYQPHRGEVLSWVNFLLEKRFISQEIDHFRRSMTTHGYPGYRTLDDLEDYELDSRSTAEDLPWSEQLFQAVNEDPDNRLEKIHILGYPRAHLKALILRRLTGESWQQISEELGPGVSTLSSFYRRKIWKYKDYLRQLIS